MNDHTTPFIIRIDWADLDLFGHVNNVAFFKYMQAARVNYCERIGLTSLNEAGKPGFMVAASQCQFKKPLLYPGHVAVHTKVDWIKNSSFQLSYRLLDQDGELHGEGQDVLVVFDYVQKTKMNIPAGMKQLMTRQEESSDDALEALRGLEQATDELSATIDRAVAKAARHLSKEQIKDAFKNYEEEQLRYMLIHSGEKEENYELCQALKELLDERKEKG